MPVIYSSVFSVIRKFPENTNVIQHLYKSNDEFTTLCDDYGLCKKALAYWNRSDSDQTAIRIREYQWLMKKLENEILNEVNKFRKIGAK